VLDFEKFCVGSIKEKEKQQQVMNKGRGRLGLGRKSENLICNRNIRKFSISFVMLQFTDWNKLFNKIQSYATFPY
jgi:hypothetical protein